MIQVRAFILLIYVDFLLKRKGFNYICETVKKTKIKNNTLNTSSDVNAICSSINSVVNNNIFFPKAECLHRSLIGYYVLAKKGMDVVFCLGVSSDGNFASHAWLELDGRVVNDEKEFTDRFNKIMTF